MKQEKLCETEDMTDKDYSRWYMDPTADSQFKEELGADNQLYEISKAMGIVPDPPRITSEVLGNIQMAAAERVPEAMKEWQETRQLATANANSRQVAGNHYKRMDIQPWDVVDYGPKQQAIGFYRYNALKYIMRAGEKGDFKEDIAKAQHYLEKLLEIL